MTSRRKISLLHAVGEPFAMLCVLFLITLGTVWWYLQRTIEAERVNVQVQLPALERAQVLTSTAARLQTLTLQTRLATNDSTIARLRPGADQAISTLTDVLFASGDVQGRAELLPLLEEVSGHVDTLAAIRIAQFDNRDTLTQARDDLIDQIDSIVKIIDLRILVHADELSREARVGSTATVPNAVVAQLESRALAIQNLEAMARSLSRLSADIQRTPLLESGSAVELAAQQHRLEIRELVDALQYLDDENARADLSARIASLRLAEQAKDSIYQQSLARQQLDRELDQVETQLDDDTTALIRLAGVIQERASESLATVPETILEQLKRYRDVIFPLSALTLLVLSATGYIVLYRMTFRPLRALTGRLGRDGPTATEQPAAYRIREIQALSDAVVQLEVLNAERSRQDAELHAKNLELQGANAALEQFAYAASHDMQEPLRKMQQFSDIVVEDYADRLDEDGRYYLSAITSSASRMSRLINDTLAYARSSPAMIDKVAIDLDDVAEAISEELASFLDDHDAHIRVGTLPKVIANRTGMEQLFRNLIVNAVKHAREGQPPRLRIDCVPDGTAGDVVLQFDDNGTGIAAKDFERIFRPFEQRLGDGATDGTGLGLAICTRVCRLHGWHLRLSSELGVGSLFSVAIPAGSMASFNNESSTETIM